MTEWLEKQTNKTTLTTATILARITKTGGGHLFGTGEQE